MGDVGIGRSVPAGAALWLAAAVALTGILVGPSPAAAQDDRHRQFDQLFMSQRYREAQQLAEKWYNNGLAQRNEAETAFWGGCLATADMGLGRLDRVEALSLRTLEYCNRVEPGGMAVGQSERRLADFYRYSARYDEAEAMLTRALATFRRNQGPRSRDVATTLHRLSMCKSDRGKYAEAEPISRQALALFVEVDGPDHYNTLAVMQDLAILLGWQARHEEEEAIFRDMLVRCRRSLPPDDSFFVVPYEGLAMAELRRDRFPEAEALFRRALAVSIKNFGEDTSEAASLQNRLSIVLLAQGKEAESAAMWAKSVALIEKLFGPDHPKLANTLIEPARKIVDKNPQQSFDTLDRCVRIYERTGSNPDKLVDAYSFRGMAAHLLGRNGVAVDDLRSAMDLADSLRRLTSGGSLDRAKAFGEYEMPFHLMVYFQHRLGEKGDPGEALAAMERFHARALLDEMLGAGAGPHAGRPAAERQAIERRGQELAAAITALETRAAAETDKARGKALGAELADARQKLYDHERDTEASDPVYKRLLGRSARLPSLADLRRDLLQPGDMLIEYMIARNSGHAVVVTPDSSWIYSGFSFNETEAKIMGVDPGEFTASRARRTMINVKGTGLLQQLANPREPVPVDKLRVMWNTITADPKVQKGLTDGSVKRLFIVPDGALGMFPFETLVVNDGPEPQYLLDKGPQVIYAPSAAVLLSLAGRLKLATPTGREPVLAVGDPAYGGGGAGDAPVVDRSGSPTARGRFRSATKGLARLPYSGVEAKWVSDVFGEAGLKTTLLTGSGATEAAVRAGAPGRRVVHFACHGLADEQYGNLFGALAFAPGPQGDRDPSDDGMMTLREIYGLDLRGNELAILSACQTNFGAEQVGEGTLAISRGFLVAGSRRVLASDWLVDDEAGASLVSGFCTQLARDEKAGRPADHARSLQEAKRWVRGQAKWQSPYYWAGLVLVGPP